MFRISKISTFESNSQQVIRNYSMSQGCSEYQRYQLLRAIHNHHLREVLQRLVVPNIKDINFWEQFTTKNCVLAENTLLFRISKISTFESNSQPNWIQVARCYRCSEYQRYQLLRAIHNPFLCLKAYLKLFRISKISTFESNSQPMRNSFQTQSCCSEYQRYQLLRAIHNEYPRYAFDFFVVPNIKDINFWEQFTTKSHERSYRLSLFRISKISTFESNSQQKSMLSRSLIRCSEYQRYQLLRAIHNLCYPVVGWSCVVPNIKDINFWEQFTTDAE